MKSAVFASAVVALASSAGVAAQDYTQSEPFFLQVKSTANKTLDGRYLFACHSGAATETLCLGDKDTPITSKSSATFFLNTTGQDAGVLVWNLKLAPAEDGTPQTVSEPMSLSYNPGSNVALTWFSPGYPDANTWVGFKNNVMYLSAYPDDSTFTEVTHPTTQPFEVRNWHACWVLAGSYFYNALAWVTSGAPRNPTCQAVSVVKVAANA